MGYNSTMHAGADAYLFHISTYCRAVLRQWISRVSPCASSMWGDPDLLDVAQRSRHRHVAAPSFQQRKCDHHCAFDHLEANVHLTHGALRICQSNDPFKKPAVNVNYFSVDWDLDVQIAGARLSRKILSSPPLRCVQIVPVFTLY